MLKLMHADFYKTFHRAYFYIMALILIGFDILVIAAIHSAEPQFQLASVSLDFIFHQLDFPILILPLLTQIVFSEEYREHTMKNTLSFGTNRLALYFSKFLTTLLLGVILAAVTVGVFFLLTVTTLQHDPAFTAEAVRTFFLRIGASCSVYGACLALSALLSVLFTRSTTLSIFVYYAIFYLPPQFFSLFQWKEASKYLLKTEMARFISLPTTQFQDPIVISLVTLAALLVGGAALFRQRDIC